MVEKVKSVSNPLTTIAIFAVLAEVNATVSIALVNEDLQEIYVWFIILFPTILVILFFITLNYNTRVIYAPSDYKDDANFYKTLMGSQLEPDEAVNNDKEIIRKTLQELGVNQQKFESVKLEVPEISINLFKIRYELEKEIKRVYLVGSRRIKDTIDPSKKIPAPLMLRLISSYDVLSESKIKAIKNIYSITSYAIHGDEEVLTQEEINYAKEVSPGLLNELRKIK